MNVSHCFLPIPIFALNSKKEFGRREFQKYILKICKEQKENQRALAFAFIIYDFEDHTILDILGNRTYWTALDKISGKYLSIFYINSQDSYYLSRQIEIQQLFEQENYEPNRKQDVLKSELLYQSPMENTVKFLKEVFGFDEDVKHPFILFFQTNGGILTDYFIVNLKQEELEKAFLELKFQISNAVEAISQVTKDNFRNHQEIFDLLRGGVESGNIHDLIRKKVTSKIGIRTIISLIKVIAGKY